MATLFLKTILSPGKRQDAGQSWCSQSGSVSCSFKELLKVMFFGQLTLLPGVSSKGIIKKNQMCGPGGSSLQTHVKFLKAQVSAIKKKKERYYYIPDKMTKTRKTDDNQTLTRCRWGRRTARGLPQCRGGRKAIWLWKHLPLSHNASEALILWLNNYTTRFYPREWQHIAPKRHGPKRPCQLYL